MLIFDNEYIEQLFIAWAWIQGYIEECDINNKQVPQKVLQIQADLEDEIRYEFGHADFEQIYHDWRREGDGSELGDKLKACPHCRGEAHIVENEPTEGFFFVECDVCSARGPITSRDIAVKLWNKRWC